MLPGSDSKPEMASNNRTRRNTPSKRNAQASRAAICAMLIRRSPGATAKAKRRT
jgi:hypothetical protein